MAYGRDQGYSHQTAYERTRQGPGDGSEALRVYCQYGWKIAFFEGLTGAPRTGIIDAIAFRLGRKNADALDLRLIQLKGGKGWGKRLGNRTTEASCFRRKREVVDGGL